MLQGLHSEFRKFEHKFAWKGTFNNMGGYRELLEGHVLIRMTFKCSWMIKVLHKRRLTRLFSDIAHFTPSIECHYGHSACEEYGDDTQHIC